MNNFTKISLISSLFLIQGCSFFNNEPDCNHPKVIESVEKLYSSQVNPSPLSPYNFLSNKQNQLNIKLQSTAGIDLINIEQIDPETLDAQTREEYSDEFMSDPSSNILYICKGTIKQTMLTRQFYKIKDKLENFDILENNTLTIPVNYTVKHEDGSDEFEVAYRVENPLHLIQATVLLSQIQNLYSDEESSIPSSEVQE